MQTLTRFRDFSKLTPEERNVFYDFGPINTVIERDRYTRDDIEHAYLDVVLEQIDLSKYGELHFHIKYLLEEKKVAINKILLFSSYKFPFFSDYFLEKVEWSDLSVLLWEDNIDLIKQKSSFTILVVITNDEWEKKINEFEFNSSARVSEKMSNLAVMFKLCDDLIKNDAYFELEVK